MGVRCLWLLVFFASHTIDGWSQENIPLGTWRMHLSYNDVNSLAVSADRVFAATNIGIIIFNKTDETITTVTKVDGLDNSIITALNHDRQRDALLIGHESGLFTILSGNQLAVINNVAVSSAISGSKRINHILIHDKWAFCSTDFGVVVLDLDKKEVKETYRDLSESGEVLRINQSSILMDSIFLATEKGVIRASLVGTSNLLDYRSWKRYDQGQLASNIPVIASYANSIHIGINAMGIFRLEGGAWVQQSYLQNESFRWLSSTMPNLVITTWDKVWLYDGVMLAQKGANEIVNPEAAIEDATGIWIADAEGGLIKIEASVARNYQPDGPSSNNGWRIKYAGDAITAVYGGFSNSIQPLSRRPLSDRFVAGQWKKLSTTSIGDITDFETWANVQFISSFGTGIERVDEEGIMIFDNSNSPLSKINPVDQFVPVTAIEGSSVGLWVANYGSPVSLHLLSADLSWQSFSFTQPQASFPTDLKVDHSGKVWMIVDPNRGGGILVFDKSTNASAYLSTQAGNGGLPSAVVHSIAFDREGQAWIGTDAGVVYYPATVNIFGGSIDPVRPVYDNRFLLRDEQVTAIAVDGGNRKWLGTSNGVWLYGPAGENLIYNFTTENSLLPSDQIIDIAIHPMSGEVFFATSNGMASFRADATESISRFSNVKIFPNPVSADFNGQVAINGLYTDANVKITDINGRMIWQTQANGGTAVWNARQLNGNRVSTGMYLVFATSEDGAERHVGKIAVIE